MDVVNHTQHAWNSVFRECYGCNNKSPVDNSDCMRQRGTARGPNVRFYGLFVVKATAPTHPLRFGPPGWQGDPPEYQPNFHN